MSDDILNQIDDVLAGDNAINDDWTVSGDAMRSRPATDHDPEYGQTQRHDHLDPLSWALAQRAADRGQAVARLAAVTNHAYAHEMRLTTGGDVRQLELITRLHVAHGFDVDSQIMVREALEAGIDPNLVARGARPLDGRIPPEPRPNLRLRVINALGLMPILARTAIWLTGASERIRLLLNRVDPRPTAFRRRRDARQPSRTITVTINIDTTAFNEAMRRVGVTAAEAGAGVAAFIQAVQLGGDDDLDRELHQIDLDDIRAHARDQLAEARAWLDHHVDDLYADLYADLGLDRTKES